MRAWSVVVRRGPKLTRPLGPLSRSVARRPSTASRSGLLSGPAWPLALPFVGLPLWWLLGVWQLMFFAMAIVMASYLVKQKSIAMPRGFSLWLLWLLWLLVGLLVLQVDVPGTVAGANLNRYLVFGYRFAWYLTATIVGLYVLNTRRTLSTSLVVRAVSWFFVMLVAGGLLGTLAPWIDFPSALQSVLPNSIANSQFIVDLTHVRTAQIQGFLGSPQARPSAPFMYTNEWGFATAISMPFFVAGWWMRGRRWRVAAMVILAIGMLPIVASLNRGLWVAILASAALLLVQSALRGHVRPLALAVVIALAAAALILFSPLGDLVTARLDNGHSDQVRENLAWTAVDMAGRGSPLVGYGTTRELEGTFSSIAGGATEACPSCEPPPIGTHGQIWSVAFAAGFVGVLLYAGFIVSQFIRNLRVRSTAAMAASVTLFGLIVTLPFYNAVGLPLYFGFVAIGVLARESQLPLPTLNDVVGPVLRQAPVVALCALMGAGVGLAANSLSSSPVTATQRVLVPAAELVPVAGARVSTLDSEALLARSQPVLETVADDLGVAPSDVARALRIGAEPNTRVLLVTYQASSRVEAARGAEIAAAAYIDQRHEILTDASQSVSERQTQWHRQLDAAYTSLWPVATAAQGGHLWTTLADIRQQWSLAARTLAPTEDNAEASMISAPVVIASDHDRTVWVASGFGVGLLVGVIGVVLMDRRYSRVGAQSSRSAQVRRPVIASVDPGDAPDIERIVQGYAPLAGVLADDGSPRAVRLAARLDRALDVDMRAGSRALVVVDATSPVGRVRRLVQRVELGGVDLVGLILLRRRERPRPLRRHTRRTVKRKSRS